MTTFVTGTRDPLAPEAPESPAESGKAAAPRSPFQVSYSDALPTTVTVESIAVPAGPTGIAGDRDGAYALVWSSFARALITIETATSKVTSSVEGGRIAPREACWLRGRELFFTNGDKRIAADGRACASCHVDGRDDDLLWTTPSGDRHTRS